MPIPRPLRGIVTPLLTPLNSPDELDIPSLERLIDHVIEGGVSGIFVLGTSGEGPSLSGRAQRQLIDASVRLADGRVPVLVGITHASFEESLLLARHAAQADADAVVTAGPLYSPVDQNQLAAYIRRLADASPLPVFLYNMPSHAHVFFDVPTVAKAASHGNIHGLKDSSGQIMYLHELHLKLEKHPDFTLLVGPEQMMPECILFGIHGGVNGGSNLFPKLYVDLYRYAHEGDVGNARFLQEQVMEIAMNLYSGSANESGYLQGAKCAASHLGLMKNVLASPYSPLGAEASTEIRSYLVKLGAIFGES